MGIDVIELHERGNGKAFGYVAKGQHVPTAFSEEIERQWDKEIVDVGEIKHIWARWVPWMGQKGVMELQFEDGPGRGVFRATYVDAEHCRFLDAEASEG